MTDAEIRGRLLTQFHALRHSNGGWVPISEINLSPEPVELRVIGGVCQQLADIGLIQWKPLRDSTGLVAGTGKITGQGVAAVESGRSAGIDVQFPPKDTARLDKTNPFPLVAAAVTGMPAAESSVIDVPEIMTASAASMEQAAQASKIQPMSAGAIQSTPPGMEKERSPLIDSVTIVGVRINVPEAQRRGRQLLQRGLTWFQRRPGGAS